MVAEEAASECAAAHACAWCGARAVEAASSGSLPRCGRCGKAAYCSHQCQRARWRAGPRRCATWRLCMTVLLRMYATVYSERLAVANIGVAMCCTAVIEACHAKPGQV